MSRTIDRFAGPAVLLAGLAVVLFFEWHTDEPLVVLPVLLVASFAAGLAMPRLYLLSGAVLGWSIGAAHAVSEAAGLLTPQYQHAPPTAQDWIAMALLIFPALAASFAGAWSRSAVGRSPA